MAWAEMEYIGSDKKDLAEQSMASLVLARQTLGLFQHHDGITGTAKDHVVLDYGDKMVASIRAVQEVVAQSAHFLLTSAKAGYKPDLGTTYFDMDEARRDSWSLPRQTEIQVETLLILLDLLRSVSKLIL